MLELLTWSVCPKLLKDGKALEFRDLGDVEAVVMEQDAGDAVAVRAAEAIEVHRGEVHAHQRMDAACVVGLQEIAMSRS